MNQTIAAFLAEGRKVRAEQSIGSVLLLDKDPWIREVVEAWILQQGTPLISCSTIEEAEAFLSQRPKCIIFGVDGQLHDEVVSFLHRVDEELPATISVVVSSYRDWVEVVRDKMPRVTFILKGEGLEDALKGLFPTNGKSA